MRPQLLADLGAHELDPADLGFAEPGLLAQCTLDLLRQLLRGRRRERRADDELVAAPELLNDRLAHADAAERLADVGNRRNLFEANLDERAPGEVDVVTQPLRHQRDDPDQRDEPGQHVGPAPIADEVVVRVPEDLDHMDTVSTFRRPM